MNTVKKIFLILIILIMACDAPRDNLFDPVNNDQTTLRVVEKYNPNTGISGIEVKSNDIDKIDITDENGFISWNHPPRDSITVFLSAENYFSDTLRINTNEVAVPMIPMDAKPGLEKLIFSSTYNNNGSNVFIFIDLSLLDKDGITDIKEVKLLQSDFGYERTLSNINITENSFSSILDITFESISPLLNKGNISEYDFYLKVVNRDVGSITENSVIFGPFFIKRVIDLELELLRPDNRRTETDSIVFKWTSIDSIAPEPLLYDYFYEIRVDGPFGTEDNVIISDISKTSTEYILKDNEIISKMQNAQYSWYLYVRDNLDNLCLSKFKLFDFEKE